MRGLSVQAAADSPEVMDLVAEVRSVRREAEGVLHLVLGGADGHTLPLWEPGAHVEVRTGGGLVRQYSLCGDPDEVGRWEIAVLREAESRGGSAWVHDAVTVGTRLELRGPRNHFPLVEAAEHLFIAGGIGITPLLPMMRTLERAGRPWRLVYGGRSRGTMPFLEVLSGYGDRVVLRPQDECGMIDVAAEVSRVGPGGAIYTCGPEGLLQAVEAHCAGARADTVHLERFRARPDDASAAAVSFEVVLELSGLTLTVPADRSIADVVIEAGVHVPTSCREGTCGTCETFVVEGIPDHRDSYLTAAERQSNEVMMVCCSRACSPRLVLDL